MIDHSGYRTVNGDWLAQPQQKLCEMFVQNIFSFCMYTIISFYGRLLLFVVVIVVSMRGSPALGFVRSDILESALDVALVFYFC